MAEGKQTFAVEVLTPEGEVFSGDVVQVSTKTQVGELGVLANHVPVLASLKPTELRLHVPGGDIVRFAQAEGYLEVFGNRALVLVQEAIPPDRLDVAELQERISDAEARIRDAEEGTAARDVAERDRERAQAFLTVAEGT